MARVNPVDSLVEAGADEQRQRGLIPDVSNIRRYVVDVVERVEAKRERKVFLKSAAVAPTAPRDTDSLERELRRRLNRRGLEVIEGKWTIERGGNRLARKKKTQSHGEKLMRARIRLLGSLPDWAAKLRRINPLALAGHLGEDKRRHAEAAVKQIITDSERTLGPWYKDPARRLTFDLSKK